jgi:hypothetical protein
MPQRLHDGTSQLTMRASGRCRLYGFVARGITAVVFACCALPPAARGHGIPLDIAFWGPFSAPTVRCQRVLGRAARRCFHQVLSLQRACMDEQLTAASCDASTRDARIAGAIGAAQDAVQECFGGQLTELRFNSFDETKFDVLRACSDEADTVMSLVYGPALANGSAAGLPAPMRQCLMHTSAASRRLLRLVLRFKSVALDRIAVRVLGPSQKQALMAQAVERVEAARQQLAARIEQACPGFDAIYGRSAGDFLAAVGARGNCVLGNVYVQNSVACPIGVR